MRRQRNTDDSSSLLFNLFMEQLKEVTENDYERKLEQLKEKFEASAKTIFPAIESLGVYRNEDK